MSYRWNLRRGSCSRGNNRRNWNRPSCTDRATSCHWLCYTCPDRCCSCPENRNNSRCSWRTKGCTGKKRSGPRRPVRSGRRTSRVPCRTDAHLQFLKQLILNEFKTTFWGFTYNARSGDWPTQRCNRQQSKWRSSSQNLFFNIQICKLFNGANFKFKNLKISNLKISNFQMSKKI